MILEDQTTVSSCNIRNPKLTVQQYVLEESIPHPYCCKCFIELTMLTLYLCCCGATYVPCVNWLYRPIMYVFCQTEFDCPNVSVNLVLGLSGICPLHGMSVVLKF